MARSESRSTKAAAVVRYGNISPWLMDLAAAEAQGLALDSANQGHIDFALAHRASLLPAQAKVFIDEIAPRAASLMYELGGASSTLRTTGLDEHWRNIVTLSSHNPAAFKARASGDYLVNGTKLPVNLYF